MKKKNFRYSVQTNSPQISLQSQRKKYIRREDRRGDIEREPRRKASRIVEKIMKGAANQKLQSLASTDRRVPYNAKNGSFYTFALHIYIFFFLLPAAGIIV